MRFRFVFQVELPFVLNLPDQTFSVRVDATTAMQVRVRGDCFLASSPEGPILVGTLDEVRIASPPNAQTVALKLKTVLEHAFEEEIADADLPPAPNDLVPIVQRALLLQGQRPSSPEDSRLAAEAVLAQLTDEQKAALGLEERKRTAAHTRFGRLDEQFLLAVNRLLRWYSVVAKDFFIEEVGLHQLALTAPKGVLRSVYVDDAVLERVPIVGKFPPIARAPWLNISQAAVNDLVTRVAGADDPDFTMVLENRARHLLERTAFRNAIAEAAAALEVTVARKIRQHMLAAGKTLADVDSELDKTNMKFPDRAEKTLKAHAGRGVKELDDPLWTQVRADRKSVRNAVVHSDREPTAAEANDVVERFLRMTALVRTL